MSTKKIAKVLLKTTCSVIFILVSLELMMIVFEPYLFKGFLEYDPDLGFRMRPHYPSFDGTPTNQFGFNAREFPLQKAPGTFRIVVVGDSFGWAGGRDGNYTALLERMFEHRDGAHLVDVVNTGYPMTHTGEELAMLKKYGMQYNPDLVVLGFVENDFLEADPDRKRIIVNGLYIDISKRNEHIVFGYPIIPQSRLLLFIEQKYKLYQEAKKVEKEAEGPQKPKATFSEDTYLQLVFAKMQFCNTSAARAKNLQGNVDLIFQSISEMDALVKSRNAKLVVAIYPDEFQVSDSLRKAVFDKYKLRPEDYDLNLAQNLLKSFLESKGIPFIDLSDRFRAEGQKRDLYLLRDTHWNSAGNQLAADMLFEFLDKRVPTGSPQGSGK
jgi:hypothetical protein